MRKGFNSAILLLQLCAFHGCCSAATSKTQTAVTVDTNGEVLGSSGGQAFIPAVKSSLTIHIPANLHKKNGESHRLSHFGAYPSRGSMSRYVYYLDDNLCDPEIFETSNKTYPKVGEHGWIHPFFILAKDWGGCTSVRMARTAQEFGASALILGEPNCPCEDKTCREAFPNEQHCLELDPPLVDDGSASDVTIPTAMLHKIPAEALYKEMKDHNQPTLIELTWGLPLSEDDIPEGQDLTEVFEPHYHLWTTAYDPLMSATAYRHLRVLAMAFGRTIHFTPRFQIQQGTHFGCPEHSDRSDASPCDRLCTNRGRYCTGSVKDIPGHDIVRESVRRLCIYQHYPAFAEDDTDKKKKKNEKINPAFWDYVIYHLEHCSSDAMYHDEKCIDEAYKSAKIDKSTIDGCMKDTGDTESDVPNSLLDEMLEKRRYSSVVEIPAITLNNNLNIEHPSARTLFSEICDLFWESTLNSPFHDEAAVQIRVPTVCEVCSSCPNVMGCLEAGRCVNVDHHNFNPFGSSDIGKKKKRGYGWTITFLLFATLTAGGVYYYYKQRDLMEHGRSLLDGYMHLSSGP